MLVRSRLAKPAGMAANIGKSLGQTAVLWVIFLFAIPAVIRWIEDSTGLDRLRFSPGAWAGVAVAAFIVCTLLGFWSGFVLVRDGNGTPFPLACTDKFVLAGPYRFIRNPMTLLGIGQGVAVGVYLGSWFVIGYALLGALAWNFLARPWEERDMLERFGAEYERYREQVPCWRFRLSPYKG